jgi:hypothetical protein
MPKSSSLHRPKFHKQKNRPHASPDAEPDIYDDFVQLSFNLEVSDEDVGNPSCDQSESYDDFVQLSFNLEVSDEDAGNPSCDQSESGTSHRGSTSLDVPPTLP